MPCLQFSGKSNVLPDHKTLATQLRKAIQRWHRSNGLPVPTDTDTEMNTLVQQQLTQHQQHATNTLNIHMLRALQERLPAGIIHCEDHFADRLIWYCPQLYHKCISGTFMNAEVFQMSEYQPLLLHEATHQRMIKRLPKHKWAFPNWGRIPSAYILPKRKKDAQKGLCDGTPNRFIRASTGTRAVGIICRRSIPDDTTGVSRLLRGRQRGESATAD